VKQIERGGQPPAQYYTQPEISDAASVYWEAFSDLSTERQIGMGVGPIPRSKIRDFASDQLGLSGDAHEQFCAVIEMVDQDYTSHANSSDKEKRSSVPIDDVEGVKAVFDLIESRKEKETSRKAGKKV
jgi:hypothetical protein